MTVSVSSGCSLFHHYHCCEAISGVPCGIKKVFRFEEFQAWNDRGFSTKSKASNDLMSGWGSLKFVYEEIPYNSFVRPILS